MGLKTPEINGARQDLPCLESPEVDGARQPVAAVKKYVDGAWTDIWTSFPSNYIIYGGKLAEGYSVAAGLSQTNEYYSDTVECGIAEIDGYYRLMLYVYPSGSVANTIAATFKCSPKFDLTGFTKLHVEMKFTDVYISERTTQTMYIGSYPATDDSSVWTSEEVDDGYTRYTFNASRLTTKQQEFKVVINAMYEVYVSHKRYYHYAYIRNIWFE